MPSCLSFSAPSGVTRFVSEPRNRIPLRTRRGRVPAEVEVGHPPMSRKLDSPETRWNGGELGCGGREAPTGCGGAASTGFAESIGILY